MLLSALARASASFGAAPPSLQAAGLRCAQNSRENPTDEGFDRSESECLSEVFDSFVLASEPWVALLQRVRICWRCSGVPGRPIASEAQVRLLCVGETLPRADIAAFAAEVASSMSEADPTRNRRVRLQVSNMLDVGLLEDRVLHYAVLCSKAAAELLEEVLPGHLASGLQLYPFRGPMFPCPVWESLGPTVAA